MKLRPDCWFLVAGMLIMACAQRDQVSSVSPAQQDVNTISVALTHNEIERIEILQIPPRVMMRARITPEMLEKQYHYKLIIRHVLDSTHRNRLIEAFKSISVRQRDDTADLRWGVIFYSRNDARVGALYFDASGGHGAVNNAPVSYQGDFFRWLDTTFSGCFQ